MGCRLVGKRCAYRWGEPFIRTMDPLNLWEGLVVTLLPFGVTLLVWVILSVMNLVAAYYHFCCQAAVVYPLFWGVLSMIAGVYAGACIYDLRDAYRLIKQAQKRKQQPQAPPTAADKETNLGVA